MRRLHVIIGCTFLLAMLLGGCTPAAETPSGSAEPIHLKLMALPTIGSSPYYIAQEEGFFAEQGLEVEFVTLTSTSEAIPALASGQLDAVTGTLTVGLLNAIAQDDSIRIVATNSYFPADYDPECPGAAIMARPDLADLPPDQVEGMRFAAEEATLNQYFVDNALKAGGLSSADVELVLLPPPARGEALAAGQLDFSMEAEPAVTRMLDAGQAVRWALVAEIAPDMDTTFLMYGPVLLEDNREVGERFLTALLKGVRQYAEGKTERNIAIITQYTQLEPDLLERACWSAAKLDGSVNVQSLLEFQTWAQGYGFLENTVTEDQLWDSAFVEAAAARLEDSTP